MLWSTKQRQEASLHEQLEREEPGTSWEELSQPEGKARGDTDFPHGNGHPHNLLEAGVRKSLWTQVLAKQRVKPGAPESMLPPPRPLKGEEQKPRAPAATGEKLCEEEELRVTVLSRNPGCVFLLFNKPSG